VELPGLAAAAGVCSCWLGVSTGASAIWGSKYELTDDSRISLLLWETRLRQHFWILPAALAWSVCELELCARPTLVGCTDAKEIPDADGAIVEPAPDWRDNVTCEPWLQGRSHSDSLAVRASKNGRWLLTTMLVLSCRVRRAGRDRKVGDICTAATGATSLAVCVPSTNECCACPLPCLCTLATLREMDSRMCSTISDFIWSGAPDGARSAWLPLGLRPLASAVCGSTAATGATG